jgi:hypothetical protein
MMNSAEIRERSTVRAGSFLAGGCLPVGAKEHNLVLAER